MLANIYLHYALDMWFEETVKAHCPSAVCLCRYADDVVCAFQHETDAERFYKVLGKRLEKYGLEVAEEKMNLLRFSPLNCKKSGAFELLGFEFRWGLSPRCKPTLKRRTICKKYRASLVNFRKWCQDNCHLPKKLLFNRLNAKFRGYYQYYGIRGNFRSLNNFLYQAKRILCKVLNRRSQRRSYNWNGFAGLLKAFPLQKPRICHDF